MSRPWSGQAKRKEARLALAIFVSVLGTSFLIVTQFARPSFIPTIVLTACTAYGLWHTVQILTHWRLDQR